MLKVAHIPENRSPRRLASVLQQLSRCRTRRSFASETSSSDASRPGNFFAEFAVEPVAPILPHVSLNNTIGSLTRFRCLFQMVQCIADIFVASVHGFQSLQRPLATLCLKDLVIVGARTDVLQSPHAAQYTRPICGEFVRCLNDCTMRKRCVGQQLYSSGASLLKDIAPDCCIRSCASETSS